MHFDNLSDAEAGDFFWHLGWNNLAERLWRLADTPDPDEVEATLEKKYEVQLEQSEFRRQLIERIQELCKEPGTKRELTAAITAEIENSFVDL